ncbi:MAG: biopolymer transporter ExbD [Lentisphaeraceae bacterium]|nr:biopolymer transporter ExbD [Lentisphaeraceae bacterium]
MSVRKEEKQEVPVSSLIDVVFLLIMFFVITSNIEKEAFDVQINLVKAKNMKPAIQIPPLRITINVQVDNVDPDAGVIYVESVPVAAEHLKSALIGFKNRAGTGGVVMIRADKDVLFTHESDVIEAIKASGLSNIRIQAELEGK